VRTIGLDLHTQFIEVAIFQPGQRALHKRIPATPTALRHFARA
jgi:hypothetical protein